ncbi:DUF2850 domain-containing protein [Vibrio sp. S9_S30]|uniref:DUF2850 domain-containing protein n=1 Tax=Vibrio sp. S9_S30 TaxID=2720226 RepID=UPI001680C44B|nr:DUF2850 domain-containing protein [Vibrio sp. S9_S30]MBD1555692.1 DUF2850 domain-containing protein [Vibrio sp. S9_S30]
MSDEVSKMLRGSLSRDVSYYVRTILLIGTVVIGAVVALYHVLGGHQVHQQDLKKKIYGHWVEQHVAPYVSDSYTIKPEGIYRDGRILTSNFNFNGTELAFEIGGIEHEFIVVSESFNRMRRLRPEHYESIFLNTSPPVVLNSSN